MLEAITHPRIALRAREAFARAAASGTGLVVYDAALLVERGLHAAMDALVVVTASEATQIRRLRDRDGAGEEEARARIAAQMPLADKGAVADFVVENDGDLAATRTRTRTVWDALVLRFASERGAR